MCAPSQLLEQNYTLWDIFSFHSLETSQYFGTCQKTLVELRHMA